MKKRPIYVLSHTWEKVRETNIELATITVSYTTAAFWTTLANLG